MEGADFVRFAKGRDEGFVFRNVEAGVTAVSGVDEGLEVGVTNLFVEAGEDGADFGKGSEVLEFTGAEEFDVPVFDTGTCESGFLVGAVVEFDVLGDTGLEFFIVGGRSAFHPGFHRGRVDLSDVVAKSGIQVDEELVEGFVFISGVHGVDSADHHDELGLEPKLSDGGDEGIFFFRKGGAKGRDLDEINFDGGEFEDFACSGGNNEFAIRIAWKSSVFIGDEGFKEAEVGAEDAEFDTGSVFDGSDGHGREIFRCRTGWEGDLCSSFRKMASICSRI